MKKLTDFFSKYGIMIAVVFSFLTFLNTCGNPNKSTNKRLDALTAEVDSLKNITVTNKDLQIEGLKAEKRMIQSTDRKMLDVTRQTEIDKEIQNLEK